MVVLNTETLTFVLALASFVLVSLAPVIHARQSHLERLEQRMRDEDERKELRRKEKINYYTEHINKLIQLRTELWTAIDNDHRRRASENIYGILLSMNDQQLADIGADFSKVHLEVDEVREICNRAIVSIGIIISKLRHE